MHFRPCYETGLTPQTAPSLPAQVSRNGSKWQVYQ